MLKKDALYHVVVGMKNTFAEIVNSFCGSTFEALTRPLNRLIIKTEQLLSYDHKVDVVVQSQTVFDSLLN